MTLSHMNNIGYIFIVRRLGKQSKLILSRSDSISNLELNLEYMAYVAQMLTQEPIYKPSSIFCFKLILLSAHKLILLIYGDNNSSLLVSIKGGGGLPWGRLSRLCTAHRAHSLASSSNIATRYAQLLF